MKLIDIRFKGHVNTYVDPSTGQTYDYGVQIFSNISIVTNYFEHFNIPLAPLTSSGGGVSVPVNFETGDVVPASKLIGGNLTAALLEYLAQENKYPEIFENWDLPYPVPEELLMPFGDFIKKYDLSALAYDSFSYDQGAANILAQPTLYMMKYQDRIQTQDQIAGGFIRNALGDNQELYDKALAELGSNAFISSHVEHVKRLEDCVEVYVSTPDGQKVIKASKLLISIPPTLSNLGFLDLTSHESGLFGQWNNSYYWDVVMKNTGIPDNTSLANFNPNAPLNLPAMPGIYGFEATPITNLHATYYSSPGPMSNAEVKADILATLARVRSGLGYPPLSKPPEFVGFHDHAPFVLTVSNDAIKNGFYKQLLALQGKKNTWWTGAAWMNQASSTLWKYDEEQILPQVVA